MEGCHISCGGWLHLHINITPPKGHGGFAIQAVKSWKKAGRGNGECQLLVVAQKKVAEYISDLKAIFRDGRETSLALLHHQETYWGKEQNIKD